MSVLHTEFLGVAGLPVTCARVSGFHCSPGISSQSLGQALLPLGQRKVALVAAVPVRVGVSGVQLVAMETEEKFLSTLGCYGHGGETF